MSTFRYIAVPLDGGGGGTKRRGEMTGGSAADVRASLRRIGWQVVEIRGIRQRATGDGAGASSAPGLIRRWWSAHLRRRRQLERSDLCDSLATMLESGLPVMDAVRTMVASDQSTGGAARTMLVEVRDALQGGAAFGEAVSRQPGWFDRAQVAMIEAGQQRGELAEVLRHLAQRSAKSEQLTRKLFGALTYPAVVATVGMAVVIFLSRKTLPELTTILIDAGLEVPALTAAVMAFGRFVVEQWFVVLLGLAVVAGAGVLAVTLMERYEVTMPSWIQRLTPRVLRRLGIAGLSARLAELVRAGIPVSEAMRIAAPTIGSRGLRRAIEQAAQRLERGHDLASALDDHDWFDAEYRQLVAVGQASGELDAVLERLGGRYERQAERLIDRLATLLEPAVILVLAALVGTVVMSAVLPLLRLQEILR